MMIEVFKIWGFSLLQAGLSATFALLLGLPAALGLIRFAARGVGSKMLRICVLFPSLIPQLAIILAWMSWFPQQRGIIPVVTAHVFIFLPLLALRLEHLVDLKLGSLAETSYIFGVARWHFVAKVLIPMLKRDLALLWLMVVALSLSSFSLPLILGGTQALTLESYIYQQIQFGNDRSSIYFAAGMQFLSLSVLIIFVHRQKLISVENHRQTTWLGWWPGLLFALFPFAFLTTGFAPWLYQGLSEFKEQISTVPSDLWLSILGSCAVALCTGFMTIILLACYAFLRPTGFVHKLFLFVSVPSSALIGLFLLQSFPSGVAAGYLKIVLGLSILNIPFFLRLGWDGEFQALHSQWETAWLFGASRSASFFKIILPQLWRSLCIFAGLAAFWSWGDFALSSMVTEERLTLAVWVKSLMDSYRLSLSFGFFLICLFGGAMSFLIFWGVAHVGRAQS